MRVGILAKAADDVFPLSGRDLPVIFQGTETGQSLGQAFERLDPLAEYQRLASAGRNLLQIGFQPLSFELAQVTGSKLQICFSRSTSSNT